jgi:hypothetical protein
MKKKIWASLAAAAVLLYGCSSLRWSGSPDPELDPHWVWSTGDLMISTEPAKPHPAALSAPENLPRTLYYADLGPDAIDVADYPAQQKYNYTIFQQECARCHTLARAINSPVESRMYWHFHLARMSLHSRVRHQGPISASETKAILDFLEYDSQVRKVQNNKIFEEQTAELKRRFEPLLKSLLDQMRQTSQPDSPPAAK